MFSGLFTKLKNFFIRFFYGSKLTLLSLTAYAHYKKLLLLPIIAAILHTILFTLFLGVIFIIYDAQIRTHYIVGPLASMPLIFSILVIRVFIDMMATYMIDQYCQYNYAALTTSFVKSLKKIRLILMWASISIIVWLASSKKRSAISSSSNIGQFVVGTSWHYLSFFLYPIVAFEERNIWSSLQK
jgi:hypothetical protein